MTLSEIKVGAHRYEVRYLDRDDMDHSGRFGSCNRNQMVIYLPSAPHVPESKLLETLIHELVHAILLHFSSEDDVEKLSEEQVAGVIGFGLATVLVDNPGILDVAVQENVVQRAWKTLFGDPKISEKVKVGEVPDVDIKNRCSAESGSSSDTQPEPTHDIGWAVEQMKAGRTVQRKSTPSLVVLNTAISNSHDLTWRIAAKDLVATDWEIVQ